jgi:hypothetical protein
MSSTADILHRDYGSYNKILMIILVMFKYTLEYLREQLEPTIFLRSQQLTSTQEKQPFIARN